MAPQISALLEFRPHHQLLRHSVSDSNCGPLLPYTGGQNYLAHFEALSHHCHVSYHTSRITTSEIKVGRGAISHDPPTDTSPHLPTNDFVARLIMDSTAHPRTEGCRYSFDVFDVSSTVEHVRDLNCLKCENVTLFAFNSPLLRTNDFVTRLIMDSTAHPRTEGCRYSFDVFHVSSTVEHVRDLDCHVRKCHAFCL